MEISILVFVLILIRVATFFAVLPFFGRRLIPNMILIGLSLSLATLWFTGLPEIPAHFLDNPETKLTWFGFLVFGVGEFLVGAIVGLAFGIFVYPIQIAGAYLAQEMGLSIASLSDPTTQVNSDVVASLMQTLALLMFFCLDLHHFILRILGATFEVVPVGRLPSLESATEIAIYNFGQMEQAGLSIIAPVGICLFVVLVSLILLTKAAPTMNIFSVGLTIRVGAGLIFVFLFYPHILGAITRYFEESQNWMIEFVNGLM